MTTGQDDIHYYQGRLMFEQQAALTASESHARVIHRQMAKRYEALITKLSTIDGREAVLADG